jgi:hypothetical protein
MRAASLERMEVILRMSVDYIRDMMERDRSGPRFSAFIERTNIAPLRLPLDLMSDGEAAREIAAAVYRTLLRENRS